MLGPLVSEGEQWFWSWLDGASGGFGVVNGPQSKCSLHARDLVTPAALCNAQPPGFEGGCHFGMSLQNVVSEGSFDATQMKCLCLQVELHHTVCGVACKF